MLKHGESPLGLVRPVLDERCVQNVLSRPTARKKPRVHRLILKGGSMAPYEPPSRSATVTVQQVALARFLSRRRASYVADF